MESVSLSSDQSRGFHIRPRKADLLTAEIQVASGKSRLELLGNIVEW